MNRTLWPMLVCCVALACEDGVQQAVSLEPAALFGGHAKWRHKHHDHGHCEPAGATSSCNWTSYERGLFGSNAFFALFDERERGAAYAVSGGSVWQSTDSGESWSPRGDAGSNIVRLIADGPEPSDLLAVTSGGLKVSGNSAGDWSELALTGLAMEMLDSPALQPQRMYASIDNGPLLISGTAGRHWSLAGSNYPRGDTYGVSVDPRSPLDVLAAIQFFQPDLAAYSGRGAIFRTPDGGITWSKVYEPDANVNVLVRCAAEPDRLFVGTRAGVARSFDNGATWTLTPIASTTAEGITWLTVNPRNCDEYYAMKANEGPVHTRDGGASFSAPLIAGLQHATIGASPGTIAIDPEDTTHLIFATHAGFYASHDSGEHWSPLPIMLDLLPSALEVSAHNPSEVWLVTWGQGVWKRSSAAADWERVGVGRLPSDYAASLTLDPETERALIGMDPPIFSANDQSFTTIGEYSTALGGAFHPSDPAVIYLTTQVRGVFKSEDGGSSWHSVNGGLPVWNTPSSNGIDARAIVLNPARPEQLFLTTNGHGIYRSDDAAASWTQVLSSTEAASCLVIAPQPTGGPMRLYACLSGVTASADGGATWSQLSAGLPSLGVHKIVHDHVTENLYATTGSGVYVLPAGADAWRALDPECQRGVSGLVIMEDAGQRYLVVGAEHGIRRIAL